MKYNKRTKTRTTSGTYETSMLMKEDFTHLWVNYVKELQSASGCTPVGMWYLSVHSPVKREK